MGLSFSVEFQRLPLKFHWKSYPYSEIYDIIKFEILCVFLNSPQVFTPEIPRFIWNTLCIYITEHYYSGKMNSSIIKQMMGLPTSSPFSNNISSPYCVQVMPHGDIDLGRHWLRKWLPFRQQDITWPNVDSTSSLRSSDNHLRAISEDTWAINN